jgi:hypothetical protein
LATLRAPALRAPVFLVAASPQLSAEKIREKSNVICHLRRRFRELRVQMEVVVSLRARLEREQERLLTMLASFSHQQVGCPPNLAKFIFNISPNIEVPGA